MYRRPKSLEVILAIRTAMSEEAGYDVPTFIEMVRTGAAPSDRSRIVTREEGGLDKEPQPQPVTGPSNVEVSDH